MPYKDPATRSKIFVQHFVGLTPLERLACHVRLCLINISFPLDECFDFDQIFLLTFKNVEAMLKTFSVK